MKTVFLVFGIFISCSAYSKEDCSLSALHLNYKSNISESLYYTGTCHYRNKDYEKSAKAWQQLAELNNVEKEYQHLQINVLNNLGYLMFFSLGIEKEQSKAISYWKKAITLGQAESEYHLCHAYADRKESTYNREKAKMYCKKALLIYRGMKQKDEEILSQIEKYYKRVK